DVIDFSGARRANEFHKCFDEIEAVDVVAHLFAFVPKNTVRPAAHGADHQIRKKTVQLSPSMRRSRKTTATERDGRHSEIAAVFLDENVRGDLRRAKERMLRVIDAHGLRNAGLIFVARLDFPAFLQLAQRKAIRRVAIDFVRGCKDQRRLRGKFLAASSKFSVPFALTVKSVCGSRAAQSCDGCDAVCTIAPIESRCRLNSSVTAAVSRTSRS